VETSSEGIWLTCMSACGGSSRVGGGFEGSRGWRGSDGFEESAKRRFCERILHCRQADAFNEGRLTIRKDCGAAENAIESKRSLGANRISGCIATLFVNVYVATFFEVEALPLNSRMTDPESQWWGVRKGPINPTIYPTFFLDFVNIFLPILRCFCHSLIDTINPL
jgi:hypothetical protein